MMTTSIRAMAIILVWLCNNICSLKDFVLQVLCRHEVVLSLAFWIHSWGRERTCKPSRLIRWHPSSQWQGRCHSILPSNWEEDMTWIAEKMGWSKICFWARHTFSCSVATTFLRSSNSFIASLIVEGMAYRWQPQNCRKPFSSTIRCRILNNLILNKISSLRCVFAWAARLRNV
jgi:hypothetical protein